MQLYDDDDPFLMWLYRLHAVGAVHLGGTRPKNIVLTELAAQCFALGVAEDGAAVLGVQRAEATALGAVAWDASGFLPDQRARRWLCLHAEDGRRRAAARQVLRLWIPMGLAMHGAWCEAPPASLRLALGRVDVGVLRFEGYLDHAPLPLTVRSGGPS